MSKIIGIDLGTTNSCVAVMEGGKPTVIVNAEGMRTTPSVVSFKNGDIAVGESARRQAATNLDTVFSIKRHMGTDYKVHIKSTNKDYTPQEISAMILQNLKATAEAYLGEKVTEAVILMMPSDKQQKMLVKLQVLKLNVLSMNPLLLLWLMV